jgi:hypothetical protein
MELIRRDESDKAVLFQVALINPDLLSKILFYSEKLIFPPCRVNQGSRDSSVGIATGYGLDGPGIESR